MQSVWMACMMHLHFTSLYSLPKTKIYCMQQEQLQQQYALLRTTTQCNGLWISLKLRESRRARAKKNCASRTKNEESTKKNLQLKPCPCARKVSVPNENFNRNKKKLIPINFIAPARLSGTMARLECNVRSFVLWTSSIRSLHLNIIIHFFLHFLSRFAIPARTDRNEYKIWCYHL